MVKGKEIQTSSVLAARIAQAEALRDLCRRVSVVLSKRAEKLRRRREAINAVSGIVGGLSIVLSVFVGGNEGMEIITQVATAIAGAVLIFLPTLFKYMVPDAPSRLQDYALYIGQFADRIDQRLLMRDQESLSARIIEIIAMAQFNLTDVRTKWPVLLQEYEFNSAMDELADLSKKPAKQLG